MHGQRHDLAVAQAARGVAVDFTETAHCRRGVHCAVCRDLETGRAWRREVAERFGMPADGVDWECPLGVPWGYQGATPAGVRETALDYVAERRAACDACEKTGLECEVRLQVTSRPPAANPAGSAASSPAMTRAAPRTRRGGRPCPVNRVGLWADLPGPPFDPEREVHPPSVWRAASTTPRSATRSTSGTIRSRRAREVSLRRYPYPIGLLPKT
jgi:hypothetical protein